MKIDLTFNLKLYSNIQKNPIEVDIMGDAPYSVSFIDSQKINITLNIDSKNSQESILLLKIKNFISRPETKIKIENVMINSKDLGNESHDYFDLHISNGQIIKKIYELCFNGELRMPLDRIYERLVWCPWYYSDRRDDFVFDNRLLNSFDTGSGAKPWSLENQSTTKNYFNKPHHEYNIEKEYELGVFGCSMTYGTALREDEMYSNLINSNNINLALPGLGMDGIFLNLKNALTKFRWKKTVIVLPNWDRKLLRISLPNKKCMRMPSSIVEAGFIIEWDQTLLKHWAWETFSRNISSECLKKWKKQYNKIILDILQDKVKKYNEKILKKLIKLCETSKKEFYIGSWNEEVYDWLQENLSQSNLLPYFKTVDYARDNLHPGPKSHQLWAKSTKSKISNN